MTRRRDDPLFVPKATAKYMSELFNFQLTQNQRDKLGRLARRSNKPMSAAAWLRKQIDIAEEKT